MRVAINFLVICLFICYSAIAQEEEQTSSGFGGMGYFQPGLSYRLPNDLGTELNTFLLESENYPQIGFLLGGGGFMKIGSRLTVGGNGMAMLYPSVQGEESTVTLIGGGGGFNVGWILYERGPMFGFPFIGIGGFGYNMEVENEGSLVNQGRFFIPPGETLKINGELIYVDIGVQILRFIAGDSNGGPVVGITAGFMQKITGTTWETDEGFNLTNLSNPEMSMAYIKICIGGGGFN